MPGCGFIDDNGMNGDVSLPQGGQSRQSMAKAAEIMSGDKDGWNRKFGHPIQNGMPIGQGNHDSANPFDQNQLFVTRQNVAAVGDEGIEWNRTLFLPRSHGGRERCGVTPGRYAFDMCRCDRQTEAVQQQARIAGGGGGRIKTADNGFGDGDAAPCGSGLSRHGGSDKGFADARAGRGDKKTLFHACFLP